MKDNKKIAVIIPAAGQGKRMKSDVSKQFIEIEGKPILAYTIEKFESTNIIDEIVVVVGKGEEDYVGEFIRDRYDFTSISKIVTGGKERQDSVYEGLKAISHDIDIVLIHDGARPMINPLDIEKIIDNTIRYKACVIGVKVKDTIKIVDTEGNVVETPKRKYLYAVQTPQAFETELIRNAYEKGVQEGVTVTDDSSLVEKYSNVKVKMIEGSYENIKITTPEDFYIAKRIINS